MERVIKSKTKEKFMKEFYFGRQRRYTAQEIAEAEQVPLNGGLNPSILSEKVENTIFFYSEIYRDSILKLNKDLMTLNNDMLYTSIIQKTKPGEIFLFINSYGGILTDGLSVMDTILNSNIKVNTIIDGMAASAATLISVVGHRRYMKRNSYILIHQLSSGMWGTYEEMQDDMTNSTKLMKQLKELYKKYTKMPMKRLDEILKRDLMLSAEEALEYGLIDDYWENYGA